MTRRLIFALVASACALAVAAAAGTSAPVALEPAPPPAICRAPAPPAGSVGPDGPVGDLSAYQDYRSGLDIGPGLRGAGVEVADIEYAWRAGHLELAARGLPAAPPNNLPAFYEAPDHGTAVLGILGATADGQGVSGLVPEAVLSPISPYAGGPSSYNPVAAIRTATGRLGPGDVLLVELQAFDAQGRLVPVEYNPEVRNEIRRAVNRGIVVVEPAGNGNIDIADSGQPWLADPNAPSHSGALIVGAGGSPFAPGTTDLERVGGSNFGARVDLQGVGAAVVTSGYGALGGTDDRAYTACFDGTSSASATVAGAVAALQSGAIARTGSPMSPAAVRDLLVTTGLPQAGDATGERIGPRPQVDAALAVLPNTPPPPSDSGSSTAVPSAPVTLVPASPAVGAARTARTAPAVKAVSAVFQRRSGKLVIRLKGLARSAIVTVAGRRVRVVRGRAVVSRVRPGRLVVRVRAPRRAGVSYSAVRIRVVVPVRGAARIVRI